MLYWIRSWRNLELENIFLCYLSSKNAIDKDLMEKIMHHAVKGIYLDAMAETLVSWNEKKWNEQENEWLSFLKRLQNQPALFQVVNINEVEKCPRYFLTELGGSIPSAQWLVIIFFAMVEWRCDY